MDEAWLGRPNQKSINRSIEEGGRSSIRLSSARALIAACPTHLRSLFYHSNRQTRPKNQKPISFRVRVAKSPPGVELPKVEPKFTPPFLGFTKTAKIWNSRACMIGLIGTFVVELVILFPSFINLI
ncbi:hypothetical protein NE237_006424 [Protea cynaroides]|uniref:Uncharacterized protein n=1 Tax=Protea cynaroides TaxID=273540 RepID=A0A9Q0KMK6_9MAGN|nr:hypothetical protein NE237_006424 [Protea cynaroides]